MQVQALGWPSAKKLWPITAGQSRPSASPARVLPFTFISLIRRSRKETFSQNALQSATDAFRYFYYRISVTLYNRLLWAGRATKPKPYRMKRILLVEDDRRIAQTISRGLTDEGYSTVIAYDGPEGREKALSNEFDLLILDVNLPGLSGYDLCRDVRATNPYIPVLMLTALGEIEDKVTGLGVGADDYLVKPFDFRELLARVTACLRRADIRHEPDDIIRVANLTLNRTTRQVYRNDTLIDLTTKEFVLLDYLMQHNGRAISRLELTEHVWNMPFDTGTNVVEVYVNYLRKKVDRDFSPKLIHTRSGYGYVLKEE